MPELLRASLDRVLLASEGGDPRGVREIPKVLLWSTSPPRDLGHDHLEGEPVHECRRHSPPSRRQHRSRLGPQALGTSSGTEALVRASIVLEGFSDRLDRGPESAVGPLVVDPAVFLGRGNAQHPDRRESLELDRGRALHDDTGRRLGLVEPPVRLLENPQREA